VADLDDLRERIDRIDREMVRLLAERAEVAGAIGARKRESGQAALDAARERDLLERLALEERGSIPLSGLQAIFREILSASRAVQGGARVGYLGQPGGFAQQAAARRFGESSTYEPLASPQRLLEQVESERLEYGVFAMEGDPEDPSFDAFDLFLAATVRIVAEFVDVAGYQALGFVAAAEAKRLYAHPAALALCARWRGTLPAGITVTPTAGSLEAGERTAEDPGSLGLAPPIVAQSLRLPVVDPAAEDAPRRPRRFYVLGPGEAKPSGRDKTVLLFSLENRPGRLLEVLRRLAEREINVGWIESRTHRWRPGEHLFLLELQGHHLESPLRETLHDLEPSTQLHRVLGSFPAADPAP
jgi:chorismate mutase/prephenate dehydratase